MNYPKCAVTVSTSSRDVRISWHVCSRRPKRWPLEGRAGQPGLGVGNHFPYAPNGKRSGERIDCPSVSRTAIGVEKAAIPDA